MNYNEDIKDIWSRQQTLKLIQLYRQSGCLWNPLDIHFISKPKRSEAFHTILNELRKIKPDVSLNCIKGKIRTLQSQLSKERTKINNSKRSGNGSDQVYSSTLWCYDELSFLLYSNDTEPSCSNIYPEHIGIEEQEQVHNSEIDSDIILGSTQSRRQKTTKVSLAQQLQREARELIKSSNQYVSQPASLKSKEEAFCNYLCTELRRLKLEASFDEIKMKILVLVGDKILEEDKMLQRHKDLHISQRDSPLPSSSPIPYQKPTISYSPIPHSSQYQEPIKSHSPIPSSSPLSYQKPITSHSPLPSNSPLTSRSPLPFSFQNSIVIPSPIISQTNKKIKFKQEKNINFTHISKKNNKIENELLYESPTVLSNSSSSSNTPLPIIQYNSPITPESSRDIPSPILKNPPKNTTKNIQIISTEIVKPGYDILELAIESLVDNENELDEEEYYSYDSYIDY